VIYFMQPVEGGPVNRAEVGVQSRGRSRWGRNAPELMLPDATAAMFRRGQVDLTGRPER
jgi:hypothetical protein